jgi:hypothetical protein
MGPLRNLDNPQTSVIPARRFSTAEGPVTLESSDFRLSNDLESLGPSLRWDDELDASYRCPMGGNK